jgi:indolepyruvate ferredoxin oxidoreductase
VRALDQTGLAQKGGAVVSDLTISAGPAELASKLGESRCDLYLGCDALVATDSSYLKATDPERTVAVISVTLTPTGAMVTDTSVAYPEQAAIRLAVDGATARAAYLDAGAIARQGLDDEQYANMVLVGAAYQSGALPLAAEAIEQAVELNGVAVAANIQAFRRGRQAIARPEELRASLVADGPASAAARAGRAAGRAFPAGGRRAAGEIGARPGDASVLTTSTRPRGGRPGNGLPYRGRPGPLHQLRDVRGGRTGAGPFRRRQHRRAHPRR